jgi:BirA family transcriptional regulator, biotin operon repressor / biotin---[acetyl-CoA-carboxylase] ligase
MAERVALGSVDSTQLEAIRRVRAGAGPGTVVVAAQQTQGRGRLDHGWASPLGGLYLSVVSRVPLHAPLVPLGVGVELRQSLHDRYGVDLSLKWPNDLVVAGPEGHLAKVGGILVDRVDTPESTPVAVVGIGLNVRASRSDFPEELRARLGFLAELTTEFPTLRQLEPMATGAVERTVQRLETAEGAATVVSEYQRHLAGVGHLVRVDGETVGVLRGVAEDGAATIESGGELRRVVAGDLEVGTTQ